MKGKNMLLIVTLNSHKGGKNKSGKIRGKIPLIIITVNIH